MKLLLNDSSVLLNLLASDCLEAIAEATGWQFAVCSAVQNETKKLRDEDTGDMVLIDINPMIASGVLQVFDVAEADEQSLYVEQAGYVDDGEAMSIAIAVCRNLELAIDDKQATNHAHRCFPSLKMWTTPDILKTWSQESQVSAQQLSLAIQRIEIRARYFPAKSHPLFAWWANARSAGGLA